MIRGSFWNYWFRIISGINDVCILSKRWVCCPLMDLAGVKVNSGLKKWKNGKTQDLLFKTSNSKRFLYIFILCIFNFFYELGCIRKLFLVLKIRNYFLFCYYCFHLSSHNVSLILLNISLICWNLGNLNILLAIEVKFKLAKIYETIYLLIKIIFN